KQLIDYISSIRRLLMKFSLGFQNKIEPASNKFNYMDPNVTDHLTQRLYDYFLRVPSHKSIVFVCIGTDRSTGDSLGPLVGTHLMKHHYSGLHVFGTLDDPVHAMNLNDTISNIERLFPDAY